MADGATALDRLHRVVEGADYSVVGPTDNRVHEIDTRRFPFRTICHVERDFGDGRWRGCSGALFGPRFVLTAGHCLFSHKRGRPPTRIRVSPGRRDRDDRPFGSRFAVRAYVPRRFVRPPRPGMRRLFDYGVVVLDRPFPGIRTFMPLVPLDVESVKALGRTGLVTIAGYPGDRPTGTMWRHAETLRGATARRLLYSVDTCPGHSGSPIWCRLPAARRLALIGVHTSGIVDAEGRSFGCKRGTVLAPKGALNSGIRMTREVVANVRQPHRRAGNGRPMVRLM